jgi:hypothetical protein
MLPVPKPSETGEAPNVRPGHDLQAPGIPPKVTSQGGPTFDLRVPGLPHPRPTESLLAVRHERGGRPERRAYFHEDASYSHAPKPEYSPRLLDERHLLLYYKSFVYAVLFRLRFIWADISSPRTGGGNSFLPSLTSG